MSNPAPFFDSTPLLAAIGPETCDASSLVRESPGAIVWLEDTAAIARARFTSGDGELMYQGTKHSFSISGLSTADSPASRILATGIVKRLRTLFNFAGNYEVVESRLATGDRFAYLRNERGVLIKLIAKHAGLRFRVAANGLQIRFKHSFCHRSQSPTPLGIGFAFKTGRDVQVAHDEK